MNIEQREKDRNVLDFRGQKQQKYHIGILVLLAFAVFFGIGHVGYILEPDSYNYIECNFGREPLYPIFLLIFRTIFGKSHYLQIVWVVQGLIAIVSVVYTTWWIVRYFRLKVGMYYVVFFFVLLPYWFVTIWYEPMSLWTNRIITEGLSFSVYHLFFVFVLKTVYRKRVRDYAVVCALSWCLATMRSQMLICFLICVALGCVMVWHYRKCAGFVRALIGCAASLLVMGGMYVGIKKLYQYHITDNSGNAATLQLALLANLLYSSDKEDVTCYGEKAYQIFYAELFERIEERQLNYRYTEGVLENGDHMAYAHDIIKYEIINEVYYEYLSGGYIQLEKQLSLEEFIKGLEAPLLQRNGYRLVVNSMCEWPKGYVRTIFTATESLFPFNMIYGAVMYLGAVVLLICSCVRKKWKQAVPMLVTLPMIVMTIAGVALTIFVSMRYLVYNMGIFYISGLILLLQIEGIQKRLTIDISHKK